MYIITVALIATAAVRPLFGLDMQTFIHVGIQLFNAGVLVVALRLIIYKPVSKFMENRTEGIKSQLRIAEEEAMQAKENKARYEQMLEDFQQEKVRLIDEAIEQGSAAREKMIEEAKLEIAQMRDLAQEEIRNERQLADNEMKAHIIEIAMSLAEKIVLRSMDESAHNRLFEESLVELEDLL